MDYSGVLKSNKCLYRIEAERNLKQTEEKTQTHREGNMKTEGERGVMMHPQIQDCWGSHQKMELASRGFKLVSLEGVQPHQISTLLGPRTLRKQFLLF